MSEGANQNRIRDHFAQQGVRLFRNNSGVLPNERGRPVRYGLANDSAELNRQIKSSDLIGWRPLLITPDMVGQVVAQFASVEVKDDDWQFPRPTNRSEYARCDAQRRWLRMALADGAFGGFMIDPVRGFEPCE